MLASAPPMAAVPGGSCRPPVETQSTSTETHNASIHVAISAPPTRLSGAPSSPAEAYVCVGDCGFTGTYDTVLEHEKGCPWVESSLDVQGNLVGNLIAREEHAEDADQVHGTSTRKCMRQPPLLTVLLQVYASLVQRMQLATVTPAAAEEGRLRRLQPTGNVATLTPVRAANMHGHAQSHTHHEEAHWSKLSEAEIFIQVCGIDTEACRPFSEPEEVCYMPHHSNPWIWQHAVDENHALRNFIHLLRAVHRWGVGLLRNRRKWWPGDL